MRAESSEPASVAVILTTLPDVAAGEALVKTLVEERLIACGNLIPGLVSIFRWDEKIAREKEVLVVMKAAATGVDRLFARVTALHPYALPELIELPVEAVSTAYSQWVIENTKAEV